MLRRAIFSRSGGNSAIDAKPRWTIPSKDALKYSFQPSIPDKHFNGAHWNYAPITVWLRNKRPAMEKIITDMSSTGTYVANAVFLRPGRILDSQLPGFLHKITAFFSAWLTFSLILNSTFNAENERINEISKQHSFGSALALEKEGFWRSEEEDAELRRVAFDNTCARLKELFQKGLSAATASGNFQDFEAHLFDGLDGSLEKEWLGKEKTWRFSMMPYGKDNVDTHLGFGLADGEDNGGAYQFMDIGNYGDYIDRRDSKGEPMRNQRNLYASAYLPGTK